MKVELSLNGLTTTHDYDMSVVEYEHLGSLLFYDKESVKQLIDGLKMLLIENDEV